MSELTYVNYLKDLNTRVVQRGNDLGLDFEIGSSQLRSQLNVLEKYLLINNLKLQTDTKGIENLAGFDELTEDVWKVRKQKQLIQQQKEIKTKKLLFAKGSKVSIVLKPFDTEGINDYEAPLPEPDVTTSDFDIGEESEIEKEVISDDSFSNEDNFVDNSLDLEPDLFAESTFEEDEDTDEYQGDFGENNEEEIEETEDAGEDDDSGPLLTDVFSDLQKAQNLFDEEDDEGEYLDEYAFVEEPKESYPEEKYEGNEEEPPFETSLDFGPVTQPSFGDDTLTESKDSGFEDFTFETPNSTINGDLFEGTNGTPPTQRDHVFTDTMVDKTTDALNKGLNAILKKLAK